MLKIFLAQGENLQVEVCEKQNQIFFLKSLYC